MEVTDAPQEPMATEHVMSNPNQPGSTAPLTAPPAAGLLISLPSMPHEATAELLPHLRAAFAGRQVTIASPDLAQDDASPQGAEDVRLVGYTPSVPPPGGWTLNAADYLNARELFGRFGAQAIVLLGAEAQTLDPEAILALAEPVLAGQTDLATAHYELSPRAGLVNSAILYPVTRALFAARPRFPLALDVAVSPRLLDRLAAAAQRLTASGQNAGLVWPVAEAAGAGYGMTEASVGQRALPQPDAADLNTLLAQITGSLFADVDSKAAWWQRARPVQPARPMAWPDDLLPDRVAMEHAQPMLDAFRNAYGNLHEIWSLVLPPQTLLGLKRLSVATPQSFKMADSLWTRIVYDFLLAYRLRTINRNHLLGALTPLYLAWVASHILLTAAGGDPERHIEAVAGAFEAEKPYLVSRWRWPDRFNP